MIARRFVNRKMVVCGDDCVVAVKGTVVVFECDGLSVRGLQTIAVMVRLRSMVMMNIEMNLDDKSCSLLMGVVDRLCVVLGSELLDEDVR